MLPDTNIEVRVMRTGLRAVFALCDFMPGEVMFMWDADNTFSDEEYERMSAEQRAFVRRFDGVWTFMTEPVCFVGHDVNANAHSRRGTAIALKEIHVGEEITINYEAILE